MFSIIIPTHNRSKELQITLDGYSRQTYKRLIREIIIIDDGSIDNTRQIIEKFKSNSDLNIIYHFQKNSGPGAARNKGISHAKGEVILITGDDITPDPELIQEHFFTHKNNNFADNVCVLGHTKWPPNMKVTPFMKYIQEYGMQFGYSLIKDKEEVPFNFFYTSNISINRSFLNGMQFSEDFPYASWEDVELGFRLMKKGMKLIYNSNAVGYHNHNISFLSFRRRQLQSGYSAGICFSLHPEIETLLGMRPLRRAEFMKAWEIRIAEKFCLAAERFLPFSFSAVYYIVMCYYYRMGLNYYLAGKKLNEIKYNI